MSITLNLTIAPGTDPENLRALLSVVAEFETGADNAESARRAVAPVSALPAPGPIESYYMAMAGLSNRPRVSTGNDRERHCYAQCLAKKIPIPEGMGAPVGVEVETEEGSPLPADLF